MNSADPLEKPPSSIKAVYKSYQKVSTRDLADDVNVVDLKKIPENGNEKVKRLRTIHSTEVRKLCTQFVSQGKDENIKQISDVIVYEHEDLPGT